MIQVFIADDSKIQVLILKKILIKEGFEVHTFSNGSDLLDELSQTEPNIIISDIEMPKLGGFELLKKLHKNQSYRAIPFLFISSHVDKETVQKAENAGADLFLKKPINTKKFLNIVKKYIKSTDSENPVRV